MKTGLFILAVCIAASAGASQLYQWKDAQGRMVYSDQPPPPSIRNAQQKSFKGSVIEGSENYAARMAREKYPVTLYASDCGTPCTQARQLLADRNISFSSKDPQASPEVHTELLQLIGKARVPVLLIGSEKQEGFEADAWNAALTRAGYPKQGLPVAKTPSKATAPTTTATAPNSPAPNTTAPNAPAAAPPR